ncbi:MAG: hypothetical protein CV087_17515 [Candidatus Brocadia sp. WS118]|nr:MAG: hypothetical protein CV087_17515 [Candidatus Brocadia sp. WS118]
MALNIGGDRYEFELTVKHYGKEQKFSPYEREKEPEEKLMENLEFKSLTAVEVMRKLLDYVR